MEKPTQEKALPKILCKQTFFEFLCLAFPLVTSQLAAFLSDIIFTIILGYQGDIVAVTAYGLSWTFHNMICFIAIGSFVQVAGAYCAKAYGSGNYSEMAAYAYKTAILIAIACSIYAVFVQFSEPILLRMNIAPATAQRSSMLIWLGLFPNLLLPANLLLLTYLVSQDVTCGLNLLSVVKIIMALGFGKWFIMDMGFAEIGIVYTKAIQELFVFLFFTALMCFKANKATLACPSGSMLFKNWKDFLLNNVWSFCGEYGIYLSFEVNTFIVAWLKNPVDMAVWVGFVNAYLIFYSVSIGFDNTLRTKIGQMIGEGEAQKARAKSKVYFFYIFVFAVLWGLSVGIFAESFAKLFINNAETIPKLTRCIQILAVSTFAIMAFSPFIALLRVLNMYWYLFKVAAISLPVVSVVVNAALGFWANWGLLGIVSGQMLCLHLIVLVFFIRLYAGTDWEPLVGREDFADIFEA